MIAPSGNFRTWMPPELWVLALKIKNNPLVVCLSSVCYSVIIQKQTCDNFLFLEAYHNINMFHNIYGILNVVKKVPFLYTFYPKKHTFLLLTSACYAGCYGTIFFIVTIPVSCCNMYNVYVVGYIAGAS